MYSGMSSRVKGTTSACAENTHIAGRRGDAMGNYLRVRGEYGEGIIVGGVVMELPPRARRIQARCGAAHAIPGTTSACAENTDAPRHAA